MLTLLTHVGECPGRPGRAGRRRAHAGRTRGPALRVDHGPGGWLQATGALASIVFFLVLVQLSGALRRLSGLATPAGCALLLAVVVIEAALLEAVPVAAAAGDRATVATALALSNGVFARIFPIAPTPLLFAGLGFALLGSGVLADRWARSALVVAALFELAGIAAVFGTPGLVFAIAMSVVEAIWIAAAAIALAVHPPIDPLADQDAGSPAATPAPPAPSPSAGTGIALGQSDHHRGARRASGRSSPWPAAGPVARWPSMRSSWPPPCDSVVG